MSRLPNSSLDGENMNVWSIKQTMPVMYIYVKEGWQYIILACVHYTNSSRKEAISSVKCGSQGGKKTN